MLYLLLKQRNSSAIYVVAVLAAIIINAWYLYPYTPFSKEKVKSATATEVHRDNRVSIMVANVYMKNRNAGSLLAIVRDKQPALLLAMEVDDWWIEHLRPLEDDYPYKILFPANNTYGMSLYSKLPLSGNHQYFFNHDSVPSFLTTVRLPNNAAFQLLTIHPVAPKSSKYPDNRNDEEIGLIKAARTISGAGIPAMVAGDFNDVGWSPNTSRFEEISGLTDIRYGRGLYNTFSAHNILMRWPLDYIYTSPQFKVIAIERLPAFGSDHFPFFAELTLGK